MAAVRCNIEGDIWLTNWYYICGYYMARVESGEYPKGLEGQLVADGCLVQLPPRPPVPAVVAAGPGCESAFGSFVDFMGGISIPIPNPGYLLADCTQFIGNLNFNVVWASSPAQAQARCQSIFGENVFNQDGNVWFCL